MISFSTQTEDNIFHHSDHVIEELVLNSPVMVSNSERRSVTPKMESASPIAESKTNRRREPSMSIPSEQGSTVSVNAKEWDGSFNHSNAFANDCEKQTFDRLETTPTSSNHRREPSMSIPSEQGSAVSVKVKEWAGGFNAFANTGPKQTVDRFQKTPTQENQNGRRPRTSSSEQVHSTMNLIEKSQRKPVGKETKNDSSSRSKPISSITTNDCSFVHGSKVSICEEDRRSGNDIFSRSPSSDVKDPDRPNSVRILGAF